MYVEQREWKRTGRLAAIEAENALKAEAFRGLAEDIPLWRFRDVLVKLGTELGLSGGAALYAIDLMGMLTEADWRGDGRAVTYHSLRAYARKVGKSERTICEYERQLIGAGLAHRTVKHARRHDGMGREARRTGLDWRAFGARMPELLDLLVRRKAEEQHRLDLEARIRATRRIVLGLIEALIERAGQGAALEMQARYAGADVARLRGTLDIGDLEHRLTALVMLQEDLAEALISDDAASTGDNSDFSAQTANQSEDSGGLINTTNHPSCPSDIRSVDIRPSPIGDDIFCKRPNGRNGLETKPSGGVRCETSRFGASGAASAMEGDGGLDAIPLPEIWKAAPEGWKSALGSEVDISWPVLIDLAQHFAPRLGVSPYAWQRAIRVLGPSEAAVALMVLDRNRDHPARPVMSVGGALVGMTRRAEEGGFNLAPSVYGIMARGGLPPRGSSRFGVR